MRVNGWRLKPYFQRFDSELWFELPLEIEEDEEKGSSSIPCYEEPEERLEAFMSLAPGGGANDRGFLQAKKGYKCYNPVTRQVTVSRDVVFDEMATWYADVKDDIGADVKKSVAENSNVQSQVLSGPQGLPASSHVANPWSGRLHNEGSPTRSINVSRKGKEKEVEPTCFEEAAKNVKWQEAMDEEMDALYGNETWDLVPFPKGKRPIGCRWVYRVKHDSDESVSRYKARLVAKGYAQTYGIDYEETFAPVAKMATIKAIIVVVAATKGWILHQMDVKNAFLHDVDHSLYVQKIEDSIVIITIYVDDLVIGCDALKDVEHVKALLCKQYDMKGLGELRYFLGIEMIRNEGGIWLSQKKYGLDMLMKYGMADCKPISTPLDQNLKLRIDEGEVLDDATMYCRIVGSLIYMMILRPDLSYAIGLFITSGAAFTMTDNNIDVFKMFAAEDRLDGNNYPMWAYMMQHVLMSKGIWNIVQGIDVRPRSVDVAEVVDVAGRNDAKIALLRKELESKIMNEEDDMDTFLAGIKDINEQLISAGEINSDSSLVQTVLALPAYFCRLKELKASLQQKRETFLRAEGSNTVVKRMKDDIEHYEVQLTKLKQENPFNDEDIKEVEADLGARRRMLRRLGNNDMLKLEKEAHLHQVILIMS
ncbi:hypothetical protein L7F22_018018 [Adiantum nelumboides]|nr:hypothetical protein [Adiantum nelumboides]